MAFSNYIYVVHLEADSGEWGWFNVLPTKSLAMNRAEGFAIGAASTKKVVYIPYKSNEHYCDYDSKTHVVVSQERELYHGA